MSATVATTACHGILLTKEDITSTEDNPLYGKYKFDPDTGKKVLPKIETMLDYEQLLMDNNIDYSATAAEREIVIGKRSKSIYESGVISAEPMNKQEMENLLNFCNSTLKIPKTMDDIKFWSVLYYS